MPVHEQRVVVADGGHDDVHVRIAVVARVAVVIVLEVVVVVGEHDVHERPSELLVADLRDDRVLAVRLRAEETHRGRREGDALLLAE